MRRLLIACCVSLLAPFVIRADETATSPALESLAWMAGHWSVESPGGGVTEEIWLAPRAGLMVGVNRSVSSEGRAGFEFLRIEKRGDAIAYVASPSGGPTTDFMLSGSTTTSATFENAAHDFPKRITYRLDGDQLVARVDGGSAAPEKAMEWRWTRVPAGGR